MGKKKLSHDQKRKAKLAKRAGHAPEPASLAYAGRKYRTRELTDIFFRTELGIYETFIISQRALTDPVVAAALTKLILQMREGPLPRWEADDAVQYVAGQEEDLVVDSIRRNWHDLFQSRSRPSSETLQGVLRTILHSVGVWGTRSLQSRGYLNYVEGFLRKTGARVQLLPSNQASLPQEKAEELLVIGRAWSNGDAAAGNEFRKLARALIDSGQTNRVIDVSQRLLGEIEAGPVQEELSSWSVEAQRAMQRAATPALPPPTEGGPSSSADHA